MILIQLVTNCSINSLLYITNVVRLALFIACPMGEVSTVFVLKNTYARIALFLAMLYCTNGVRIVLFIACPTNTVSIRPYGQEYVRAIADDLFIAMP
jgi:hypothetical protein